MLRGDAVNSIFGGNFFEMYVFDKLFCEYYVKLLNYKKNWTLDKYFDIIF